MGEVLAAGACAHVPAISVAPAATLSSNSLHPVQLVFDGGRLPAKAQTNQDRRERKQARAALRFVCTLCAPWAAAARQRAAGRAFRGWVAAA